MRKQDEVSMATNRNTVTKFKIVFIGDQGVGKSSIINRFIKNQFDTTHNPTVGIDFISKNMNINGKAIKLQLWDTAGQERFRSLIPTYLKDCNAAFVIYDITNRVSFESINKWIDFVRESAGSEVILQIIGNKTDLQSERAITKQLVAQRFKAQNIIFYQASAKNGLNLNQIFQNLCAELLHIPKQSIVQGKQSAIVNPKQQKNSNNIDNENGTLQTNNKKILKQKRGRQQIKQKSCCE